MLSDCKRSKLPPSAVLPQVGHVVRLPSVLGNCISIRLCMEIGGEIRVEGESLALIARGLYTGMKYNNVH